MSALYERYNKVKEQISLACKQAGRAEHEISLIAVSKRHSIESIKEIASYGQKDFGENYIQEALEKIEDMPNLSWHAIGAIQSKKTKDIIGKFDLIHTLASQSFLTELAKKLPENAEQNVLLQINIGRENQKAGLLAEECFDFVEKVLSVNKLNLQGLMCLPPFADDAEITRPYFTSLRKLKDKIEQEFQIKMPHLSMGMSGDFQVAIQEGATIIRVGTDIFGSRI